MRGGGAYRMAAVSSSGEPAWTLVLVAVPELPLMVLWVKPNTLSVHHVPISLLYAYRSTRQED